MGSGYDQKSISWGKITMIIIVTALIVGLAVAGVFLIGDDKGNPDQSNNSSSDKVVYHSEAGNGVQVGEDVSPSVVFINNIVTGSNIFFQGQSNENTELVASTGSGVIYSEDGYIITNNHVVSGASKIEVRLYDGTSYTAEVIGTDARTDLAVIKIDGKNLTPAKFGNSDELVIGEMAVAIGNPAGESFQNSLTQGVISGLDRTIQLNDGTKLTLVQTDAAINPGNSGGALCNGNSEVIGINTVKISISGYEGMGFAIPINDVLEICQQLMENGKVVRPALQVGIVADINEQIAKYNNLPVDYGVLIAPQKGGNAEKAGLQSYDIIIALDGEKVTNSTELQEKIFSKQVGDKVKVTVQRGNEQKDIEVTLGELAQ